MVAMLREGEVIEKVYDNAEKGIGYR